MNLHRCVLGGVAIAVSLAAAGCPSNEKPEHKEESKTVAAAQPTAAPTPAPTPAPTADQAAAAPAAADTTPLPAPPAEKVETMGTPPSPHHTWVHGYWHWAGKEYTWHAGYWEDQNAAPTMAPPALRVEHPGMAPGANYFYAPGYWHWTGKEYAWAPGHWTVKRDGYVYVHPTYVEEKGKWVRHGYGFEKQDDAVKKKYATGWDHHGEVLVHHPESAEFVKRGEKEGWLHHK